MNVTPTDIREYDRQAPGPEETKRATFGLGCFWGPDATFGAREGVIRTRVGYAGGTTADPSYHDLGDHTEVIQIDYDPAGIGYRDLVELAFRSHDPRKQARKRQYQNIVLTASQRQHETVIDVLDASDFDREQVRTRIEELTTFYPAEQYHQKYNLRGKRWLQRTFDEADYDGSDIRESPAAAKLNAHVAGKEIPDSVLDADESAFAYRRQTNG